MAQIIIKRSVGEKHDFAGGLTIHETVTIETGMLLPSLARLYHGLEDGLADLRAHVSIRERSEQIVVTVDNITTTKIRVMYLLDALANQPDLA